MKIYILYSFFSLLIIAGISGCQKKTSSAAPLEYTVTGQYDVTVRPHEDTTFAMPITVTYQSGTQQLVVLTPGHFPPGLTVTPTSASGTGTFTSTFTFHVNLGTTGIIYPINIVSVSPLASTQITQFNLTVL